VKLAGLMAGIVLSGGLWPFGGGRDEPRPNDTIADLGKRELELLNEPSVPNTGQLARQQYRAFLQITDGHPELRAEAMRRLADLSVAAAEEADAEGLALEPFLLDAIGLYEKLLERSPDNARRDAIVYQLARAKELTGDGDGALAGLDELIAAHPDSRFYDEGQFRRGEILFVAKRYREAAGAYAAVIDVGAASSFYEQATIPSGC
jgi:TolA-binding protein